jgi:hypothetical protein
MNLQLVNTKAVRIIAHRRNYSIRKYDADLELKWTKKNRIKYYFFSAFFYMPPSTCLMNS